MRLLYCLILFTSVNLNANELLNSLVYSAPKLTETVDVTNLAYNQLAIATPFSSPIILNPEQKRLIAEKAILKIELVYTRFRTSPSFDQLKLNYQRLGELKKMLPKLFEQPLWEFQLIEQTYGDSRAVCNDMFHGFIITFRPNASSEYLNQESDYIHDFVKEIIRTDSLNSNKEWLGYDIKTTWDDKTGYVYDTIWKSVEPVPVKHPKLFYDPLLYSDSTVIKVFERNQWENVIVVADVTGSMSPYTAQVFLWVKENIGNKGVKGFVFFNDGDDQESRRKKPMETKGVYISTNSTLDSVMMVATRCMNRGSGGGEHYENDVEAIVTGLNNLKEVEHVILIADNMESMRDFKFLDEIKVPVHAVMCGVRNRVHFQYLNLAHSTKGSVHTEETDFVDITKLKNGERFKIGELEYEFNKGKFLYIYEPY